MYMHQFIKLSDQTDALIYCVNQIKLHLIIL